MEKSELYWIAIASISIVLALFLGSFFFFTAGFELTYIVEEPLPKNAEFSLRPGDSLAYNITYLNQSAEAVFLFGAWQSGNCTLAAIAGENITTCIYPDGRDSDGNHSLAAGFFFFSPWMLALSNNFSWKSSLMNSMSNEAVQNFSVRVLGEGEHRGRSVFVVEAKETGLLGNYTRRILVDKKSRIVLKEDGENYTVEIIRAHFPLQPQAE